MHVKLQTIMYMHVQQVYPYMLALQSCKFDDLEDCCNGHSIWRGQGRCHCRPQKAERKRAREADKEASAGLHAASGFKPADFCMSTYLSHATHSISVMCLYIHCVKTVD